jgi:hypothetical protein
VATQLQVVIDAARPAAVADFWAAALGYVVQPPPPGHDSWPAFLRELGVPEDQWESRSAVVDPDGHGPRIYIQQVPEPKTVKNRVHLDVVGDAAALQAAGATLLRGRDAEIGWDVLADPEGNEFCCFAPE